MKLNSTNYNNNKTGALPLCKNAKQIGEGGFGIVIECNNRIKQSNNNKPIPSKFVLKIPKYLSVYSHENKENKAINKVYNKILDNHEKESELSKKLTHPNIVTQYDIDIIPEDIQDDLSFIKRMYSIDMWDTYLIHIFSQKQKKYLTMEYCNLGDLHSVYHMLNNESYFTNNLLKNEDITSFRNKLATELVFGIGNAICYLHSIKNKYYPMGIVHNDIKAENIMASYDSSTSKLTLKLTDFGQAFIPTESDKNLYTETTLRIGTVVYTPFHLLHKKQLSILESKLSSPLNIYKINKDVYINGNDNIFNDNEHTNVFRQISYFVDWFAYINVITMMFSNIYINTELTADSMTIILYGMLNIIDTVKNAENSNSTLKFKSLLTALKTIELELYENLTTDDTHDKYKKLHNWFNRNSTSTISDWTDLEVRFVNYNTPTGNNINLTDISNNVSKKSSKHSTNSKSQENSFITRFLKKEELRFKGRKNSLSGKKSKKNKSKKISGYSGTFAESNVAV